MTATMTKNLEYRIGKLALDRGDVLIVKLDAIFSPDQLRAMHGMLQQLAPGHKIAFLPVGVDLEILTAEDLNKIIIRPPSILVPQGSA